MILLNTTDILRFRLGGAITTNELDFVSGWVDITGFSPSNNSGTSSGATNVTLISAPSAGIRQVKFVSIVNKDTVDQTVTIEFYVDPDARQLLTWTLSVGDTLTYIDSEGWKVYDSTGKLKVTASGGGGGATGYLSAGTASMSLGTVVFSNSNGISFGLNGATVTASHNGLTSQSNQALSGSNGSFAFQTATFGESNGLLFYTTNGSMVGSYTVPSTAGLISAINVSAGTTSNNLSAITFSNSNNVSFGLNGSVITATATVASTQGSINFSGGTTSNNLSAITFSNSNGVSFGLNGSTMTGSVATSLTNINVSAGTTSNNLSAIVFSNSNNVSFGLNGSTVTATITVPAQSNQTGGVYFVGNTTGQSSSSTYDLRTLSVDGAGIVSAGWSNGTIRVSATQSNQAFSAQGGSSTFQTLSFTNSNGISFSNTNGSIWGSHNGITSQTNQDITLYATGNTTQNSSTVLNASSLLFRGTGNASLGFSNGSIIVSDTGAAGGGITNINLSAGTTSANASNFTFSDLNGISFGLNAGTITASVATSLTNIKVSAGTTSNNLSAITFSDSNGVSFGLNGSTMTASVAGNFTYSGFNPYADIVKVAGQVGNATIKIDPVRFDNVVFDRLINNLNFTATSNSSGSMTVSFWNGLYTKNASTLSLLSSFSTSTNLSMSGTVGSYSLFSGIRNLSIPASMTITQGDYWLAVVSRTTTAGAAGMTLSQQLGSNINSVFVGQFGVAHNTTMQLTLGQGIYSVTSAGLPNSIGFSEIRGSDSGARRAPFIIFAYSTV